MEKFCKTFVLGTAVLLWPGKELITLAPPRLIFSFFKKMDNFLFGKQIPNPRSDIARIFKPNGNTILTFILFTFLSFYSVHTTDETTQR